MTLNIYEFLERPNVVDLERLKELPIDQVEKLWNTLQVKSINGLNNYENLLRRKCIEVLENLYRKPWDENIFFKMIQMRLDLIQSTEANVYFNEMDMKMIKRLFSEVEMTCPFLPKSQMKRLLELQSDFAFLNFKNGIGHDKIYINQISTEMIEIFVEHKKKGIKLDRIGAKVLEMFRRQRSLNYGKQFEALIPECEEFKEFHVDLLNILTELTLERAVESKKTVQFSEFITDAINFNVHSLNIRPNVMGYFEFLKLTKLQDPKNFEEAVKTCLLTMKNRIAPNEDIRGKLQIVKLIVYETDNLEEGLRFAEEMFINCDFNESGSIIFEEILSLIDAYDARNQNNHNDNKNINIRLKLENFLTKFSDHLRTSEKSQNSVLNTLLRLAEKYFTVTEQFYRAEEILLIIQGMDTEDDLVKIRLTRCFLRLDKLEEANNLIESLINEDIGIINGNKNENDTHRIKRDIIQLQLELALRKQDDYESLSCIEKLKNDPFIRSEHFLSLFNLLKLRLSAEIKMSLLKGAHYKLKTIENDDELKVDIFRGIMSLLYDGIIESGMSPFKSDFEKVILQLKECKMKKDQIIWTCQICWNLGVIHARAEDFVNAQLGFKWCQEFSMGEREFTFKSGFYYLTAKMCTSDEIINEDYRILENCKNCKENEFNLQLICLEIELLLRDNKWEDLEIILKDCQISFEVIAELILRASVEVPLNLHRLILEKLTDEEFNCENFNMTRFAALFRGLTTCSLLQFPEDLAHFHSALKMIKSSFGRYPGDEITWLCGTALEMGRQAGEVIGEWSKAGEWTEMALNLVYLIPENENSGDSELRIMKHSLQESIQKLFEKIVNRE